MDPHSQDYRVQLIERDLGLPVKAVVLLILFYYLFLSSWISDATTAGDLAQIGRNRSLAQDTVQWSFLMYLAINVASGFILLGMQKVPTVVLEWTVFTTAVVDGLFLSGMVVITGGVESALYWLYLLLILRNSISISSVIPQLTASGLLCAFFAAASLLDQGIAQADRPDFEISRSAASTEGTSLGLALSLKVLLLVCVSAWCYGIQVLLDRQRRRLDEDREMEVRKEQLEASGRLAAEIAHQLKNPLSIINNAAFTLQRTVKEGRGTITQQIQIIREEVDKSDRLITELMGYAKLAEGRVEKVEILEEMELAIGQVFPQAAKYEVTIHRDYALGLPLLLAQRNHISEIFMNLLQNAREAMDGKGTIWITLGHGANYSILIQIRDDGPGIQQKDLNRIFEPYYTTREKGSGLGLAIVKHNTEIYGGKIRVESELGKGATFILEFPARTLIRLRK